MEVDEPIKEENDPLAALKKLNLLNKSEKKIEYFMNYFPPDNQEEF